jgi:hypothetical protein
MDVGKGMMFSANVVDGNNYGPSIGGSATGAIRVPGQDVPRGTSGTTVAVPVN